MATEAVTKHLEEARAKLGANDTEGALTALLSAWRGCRIPRIAHVIDRVSDRVTAARDPIKASSVALRTKLWLDIAKKKDSADLGRLLATPWPGTWKDALPVVTALVDFPIDPRTAMALVQLVDAVKYDTWTSVRLYQPLFRIVDKTLDVRTLPLLEAQRGRVKSRWWRRSTQLMEVAAIEKLKKAYPEGALPVLDSGGEAELTQLEAFFASDASAEQALAKGAAEFLAAIYADPDDDALRSVFADWLSERNDPRGEFITLQLARHQGRSNDASLKREASLIKQHGAEWTPAPIDCSLDKDDRVFERGFLAHGVLSFRERPKPNESPQDFSDPSWATFQSLEIGQRIQYVDGLELLVINLPSMRWVRVFRGLSEQTLATIVQSGEPRPRFDELDIVLDHSRRDDELASSESAETRRALIAKGYGRVFPNVKRLSVQDSNDLKNIPWLLTTPLVTRIERITVTTQEYPIGKLARMVEATRLMTIKELCFTTSSNSYRRHARSSWRFIATRDDNGRFTKIHGGPDGVSSIPSRHTLERTLTSLKPTELTELIIEHARVCTYDEADIKALEKRFEKFNKSTRIEVPWERLSAKPRAGELGGIPYTISIDTEKKISWTDCMPKLLAIIGEAPVSVVLDSYEVNSGKHMSLPTPTPNMTAGDAKKSSPTAVSDLVIDLLGRKRTRYVRLYRKMGSELSSLVLQTRALNLTFAYPEGGAKADRAFLDPFIAWLIRLLDVVPTSEGVAPFEFEGKNSNREVGWLEPLRGSPSFGWIIVLSNAQHGKWLDFDALEKIAKRLEWLTVHRSKRNAILVTSERRSVMPNQDARLALQLELLGLMWRSFEKLKGFVPHDLMRKMLASPLKKLGFTEVPLDDFRRAQGHLYFAARAKSGGGVTRGIVIDAYNPLQDDFTFSICAHDAPKKRNADLSIYGEASRSLQLRGKNKSLYFDGATEKEVRASLNDIIKRLDTEVLPWFETPPDTKKKKRRR